MENLSHLQEDDELLQQPVLEHLNTVRKQFPHSLEVSVLLANMAWEYAVAWQKDLNTFAYLEASLKCVNHIPNMHLKQGLYNLIWNTHLKIVFESTCKLINKVGRLPKEKLCQQDTGLSDFQIILFVDICTELFDSFINTVQSCYGTEKVRTELILKYTVFSSI